MKIKGNKVNIEGKWVKIDYSRINPKDYLSPDIIKILNQIKINTTKQKWSDFTIIEGGSGSGLGPGKSTLGSLCSLYIDNTYSETRNLYRKSHYWRVTNHFRKMHRDNDGAARGKAILMDELKRIFFIRDIQEREQKDIEKDFNDIRSLRIVWFGCIDDIRFAHKWIRESVIQNIFYIPRIGNVKVYKLYLAKNDSPMKAQYIEKTRKALLEGIHPRGIRGNFWFKQIPENNIFWINYQIRKEKYQLGFKTTKLKEKEITLKEDVEKFIEETISTTQAAKILHMTPRTIQRWQNKKLLKGYKTYRGIRFKLNDVRKVANVAYGKHLVTQSSREEFE